MSYHHRNKHRARSSSDVLHQQIRFNPNDSDIDSSSTTDSLPNVLPEVEKIIEII
jgi:hypothetical protein